MKRIVPALLLTFSLHAAPWTTQEVFSDPVVTFLQAATPTPIYDSAPPGVPDINDPEVAQKIHDFDLEGMVASVHRQVNEFRAENGLDPLITDPFVRYYSQRHSDWMAVGRYGFSHQDAEVRYQRLNELIPGVRGGGENVAFTSAQIFDPATTAVTGWMRSPGHRKNMLGDYNLTGIGIAKTEFGLHYLTQYFIRTVDADYVASLQNPAPDPEPEPEPDPEPTTPPDIDDPDVQAKLYDFPREEYLNALYERINQLRANSEREMDLLGVDAVVSSFAQKHSDKMAVHIYPPGSTDRIARIRDLAVFHFPNMHGYNEHIVVLPESTEDPVSAIMSRINGIHMFTGGFDVIGAGMSKWEDGNYYVTFIVVNTGRND